MRYKQIVDMARQAGAWPELSETPVKDVAFLTRFAALVFEQGKQKGMEQEHALWKLARLGQEIEAQPPTHTINTNHAVAVATDTYWIPIDKDTPRSVKLQLLSIGGVAQYGVLQADTSFYTHWCPVPKKPK